MIQCKICQSNCKSWGSLSKHLRDQHSAYTSNLYYDKFLLAIPLGCKVCGAPTKFETIKKGYKNTCGHKCGGIYHRKNLSADSKKHKNFINKVSANQTKIWEDRRKTGEDIYIAETIRQTINQQYSKMSADEIKEKCGWLNKLSKEDKRYWINNVMLQTGMHVWQQSANNSELETRIIKRNATKLGYTIDEYKNRFNNLTDKKQYYDKVWYLTEQTYRKYSAEIDPANLRSSEYHLDHKYSIIHGYYENIEPEIIASKFNLEILPRSINSSKSGKCSLNIATLREMYNG